MAFTSYQGKTSATGNLGERFVRCVQAMTTLYSSAPTPRYGPFHRGESFIMGSLENSKQKFGLGDDPGSLRGRRRWVRGL